MARQVRRLAIGVNGAKKIGEDFVRAWKSAEQGLPADQPVSRLHFANTALLFKYLSPKRFELLQHLRERGNLSIRKLAAELHRDYKNVHTDVKELLHIGLIEEAGDGLLSVPWDAIVSELPLAKAK